MTSFHHSIIQSMRVYATSTVTVWMRCHLINRPVNYPPSIWTSVYQMVRKRRRHISNDDIISQTVMTALIPTVSCLASHRTAGLNEGLADMLIQLSLVNRIIYKLQQDTRSPRARKPRCYVSINWCASMRSSLTGWKMYHHV